MKKLTLTENQLTKIIAQVIKEQDDVKTASEDARTIAETYGKLGQPSYNNQQLDRINGFYDYVLGYAIKHGGSKLEEDRYNRDIGGFTRDEGEFPPIPYEVIKILSKYV